MPVTTTPTSDPDTLPRWDLDSIFPGPDSPEYRVAFAAITRETVALEALFDRQGSGARPAASGDAKAAAVAEVIAAYNALLGRAAVLAGYLFCLTAADVRDEAAQRADSEWRILESRLAALAPRFTTWVGSLDLEAVAATSAWRATTSLRCAACVPPPPT